MALLSDIQDEVKEILAAAWTERDGRGVPAPADLKLGNDAMNLDAAVLYADMAGSTDLVDTHTAKFAAEVYKCYLASAARIIKDEGGVITAYDGDRVMAVYLGDNKNTAAASTGLKINYAVSKIINPAIKNQYPKTTYKLKHTVGIDSSKILVSRIGVRNDNDLVWVGKAANYAAKLCDLTDGYVFITDRVFDKLNKSAKYGGDPEELMWEERVWTAMNKDTVYRSNWTRKP